MTERYSNQKSRNRQLLEKKRRDERLFVERYNEEQLKLDLVGEPVEEPEVLYRHSLT